MKYLLVIAVVGFVLWWMLGRSRSRGRGADGAATEKRAARRGAQQPVAIVACTHCGVHLPQTETVVDGAGRLYCSESHRLAGPR